MSESNKESTCKSHHIFLYPFIIEKQAEKYQECLDSGQNWKKWKAPDYKTNPREAMDAFMVGQYFNKEARELLQDHDNGKDNCVRYRYNESIVQNTRYIIEGFVVENEIKKFYRYSLPVNNIELFLFHKKVGILKFETRTEGNVSLEDCKKINDFGRRILLPYISRDREQDKDENGTILCADYLGLQFKDNRRFVKCFRDEMREWSGLSRADYKAPAFLYALIFGEFGNDDAPESFPEMENIQSVTDDRMYLCSIILDDRLDKIIKNWGHDSEGEKEAKKRAEEKAKTIYALAFADWGDATCQNANMRRRLLDKAIYTRWSDWGTLYSVSNSAFLCMATTTAPEDAVVRPFLTEYYLIAVLVLAQKVSITDFSQQAAEKTSGVEAKDMIPENQVKDLIQLHEEYVAWMNREYLLEVTEQEQGVDIYGLLQEQLGIPMHIERLQTQLQGLFSVANVSEGRQLNQKGTELGKKGMIFAGFAVGWAFCAVLVDILLNIPNFAVSSDNEAIWFAFSSYCMSYVPAAVLVLMIVLTVVGYRWAAEKGW